MSFDTLTTGLPTSTPRPRSYAHFKHPPAEIYAVKRTTVNTVGSQPTPFLAVSFFLWKSPLLPTVNAHNKQDRSTGCTTSAADEFIAAYTHHILPAIETLFVSSPRALVGAVVVVLLLVILLLLLLVLLVPPPDLVVPCNCLAFDDRCDTCMTSLPP